MSAPFTAVVVLHDSERELARLLESLACLPERPELVVADSGSRDGGAALAREAGATVIDLPRNPGFGAAANAGVAAATAEVTVLLNPDVELLDDGLARLADHAREREALLAPRLLNPDGSIQRSAHPRPGTGTALLPALVHPRWLPRRVRLAADPWRADAPRPVGWAIAACLCARTATLRSLGPFDPGVFLYGEDLELCLRAAAAGIPVELHPEVALRHAGAHSTLAHFAGEPMELIARRRREVVGAHLGRRALALDDAAQALTFARGIAARRALGRDAARERGLLGALRAARR
jgi:N-acetylglucosaminyl-diphospho-decaprenol L-rhamnosyltransferase